MATLEQIGQALKAADAAGNTEDARRLAQAYADMRRKQGSAVQPVSSPKADFSKVTASVASTDDIVPDTYGPNGQRIPSLEEVNAKNRAYRASPQYAIDRAAAEASQLEQKTSEFRDLPLPVRVLMGAGSRIPAAAMGVGQMLGVTDNADAAQQREQARFMEGDVAAGVGQAAGDFALIAAPGTVAAKLPTLGARMLGGAGVGALQGAVRPTVEGESRAVNTGVGAGLGAAGELAGTGLRVAAKKVADAVRPEVKALYESAKQRGITLTPAQLSDSRFLKFLDSRLRTMPFSGAAARSAEQRAVFNRELAKTIGEDAESVTSDVYARAAARQSRMFEELTARNDLAVDDQLVRQLTNIANNSRMAGEQINGQVESAIEALYAQAVVSPKGVVIPGQAYQAFDSQLGQITKNGGPSAHFLGNVQTAVRKAMDKSISPEDAAAWKALRIEYGNRKTITPMVAKADGGDLSPAQLMGRVTATKSGKERMAMGKGGDIGELARIGQKLKEPPSSGTAERTAVDDLFDPLKWPKLAIGSVVGPTLGRLPNSNFLGQTMMSPVPQNALLTAARFAPVTNLSMAPAVTNELNKARKKDKK